MIDWIIDLTLDDERGENPLINNEYLLDVLEHVVTNAFGQNTLDGTFCDCCKHVIVRYDEIIFSAYNSEVRVNTINGCIYILYDGFRVYFGLNRKNPIELHQIIHTIINVRFKKNH